MIESSPLKNIFISYICMALIWLSSQIDGFPSHVILSLAVTTPPTYYLLLQQDGAEKNSTPPVRSATKPKPKTASKIDSGALLGKKLKQNTSKGNEKITSECGTPEYSPIKTCGEKDFQPVPLQSPIEPSNVMDGSVPELRIHRPTVIGSPGKTTPRPILPLKVYDLAGSKFNLDTAVEVDVNPIKPVAFENDIFKGHCIIKLRTEPIDPLYLSYFENKKRTFEFQIQGKFKKAMQDDERIMFGVETAETVNMGLLGRGICRVMLGVCNRIIPGNHWSFGSSKTKEKPHITFPIESAIDRLIVTPEGEEPPVLGVDMLPEPIDKKERSSMQLVCDAKQTYTISFHGMYVDFMKWKGVNFPGMRDVEISSLIGKIALRMVAYTVPRAYEGPHTEALKKYCFCFEMRNNGEDILYPPEDNISVQSSTFSNVYADVVSKPVPKAVMEQRILEMTKRASIMELEEIPNNSITVDCNMYLLGSSANYGVWFVLKVTHEKGQSWAVLRPAESFCELEDLHNRLNKAETASDSAGFTEFRISRISSNDDLEQHCHDITAFLRDLLRLPNGYRSVRAFLDQDFTLSCALLTGSKKDLGISIAYTLGSVSIEGPVARAMWAERWVECWGVLYSTHLCFYHSGKRNADCTIPLSEILLCHPCDTNPFEGAFLEVHTLGIVYYIAYSTAAIRDQWMNKIQAQTSAVLAASFSQGSIQLKDDQSMIASLSASARANFGGLQKTHTLGHAHQGSRARIKNKAKRISSSAHDKVLKPIKHVAGRGRDKGSTGDLDKLGKISDSLMTYNSEASMHNTTPILSNNATPEPSEPPSLNGSMSEFEGSSAAIPITGAPTDDTLEVSLHPLPRTPEPIDSPNAARQKCTTKVHSHKLSTASAHLDDSQTVVVSNIAPAMVGRNQRSSSVATAPLESVDENLSSTFLEPENPADMYLVRSKSRWKSNRIILNNRLIYFELLQPLTHPCALISAALLLVLGLNQNSSKSMIVSYLDCVSALKRISLQQLAVMDPSERKAFFLNLYHCIVAHYLLVMGTPSSTRRGISEFYDECSMQVGKNVFSLSEIENGILRAAMTPPKKSMRYNPQKAISNELRQILGAQQVDPRLAMAVNYGTKTCGQSVFIYSDDPDVLDSQLNSAARIFIQRNVMVDTKRNTVTLPKVFEVYSADFGATKLEMLDVLRKYADKYTAQEIGKVCEVMREKDAKFKKGDISWINNLDLREGRLAHLDSSN